MARISALALPLIELLLLTTAGCADVAGLSPVRGSGVDARQVRPTGTFSVVEVRGSMTVVIERGGSEELTIEGDENLLPLVRTELREERLVISARRPLRARKPLRIVASSADPHRAALYGSGNLQLHDFSGDELRLELYGSGDLSVTGAAAAVDAQLSGSGVLRLFQLAAKDVCVTVNGSGDAEIAAQESIGTTINGSGDVIVHGSPKVLRRSISGSGQLLLR